MILTGWYPIVDVVGAMFCPAVPSARRNSNVISRPSAHARSASDRSVISVSPDNWRLMFDRSLSSRRASSCWVSPARFSSVMALSSSRRIRPISLPAVVAYFVTVWKGFRSLGSNAYLSPTMRGFFQGATAGLLCMLVTGFAGSSLRPTTEFAFLWIAIGMMYGMRARTAQGAAKSVA